MELRDKKRMAKRILGGCPEEYRQMLDFIDRFPEMQETPAQFQERCAQLALRRFWEEENRLADDVPTVRPAGRVANGDGVPTYSI
jgi:hypothetical protein